MKRRVSCTMTAAMLAVSLGLSGCSFSIKVGDKEITNRKEPAAETSVEDTEVSSDKETTSAVESPHKRVEPTEETRLDLPETAGYGAEDGGGSAVAGHVVTLSSGCKVYYDGADVLDFQGTQTEFNYTNDDMMFAVTNLPDNESVLSTVCLALYQYPDYLDDELKDVFVAAYAQVGMTDAKVDYIKGYSWFDGSDIVNVDCAEYKATAEGRTLTLITMFMGNDNNATIVFNDACGINPKSVGFEINGKKFMLAEAKEVNIGEWAAKYFSEVLLGQSSGNISGSGEQPTTSGYTPSGLYNKVTAPAGWENSYESESAQQFSKGWEETVTLWEFDYYGDDAPGSSTVASRCYVRKTDYSTYYYYPIDSDHHIEIQLDNDTDASQAHADELYQMFYKLWVK